MKEKRYLAFGDNGRDYIEFYFYSSRRANSKENIKDALRTYKKRHGTSNVPVITSTRLENDK